MHEVIHLSLSSISNHLNSHFYNAQESYFVYTDAELADSKVDPSIRFQQGIGYTPRALIWDLRGGFGALKQYSGAYTDSHQTSNLWEEGGGTRKIITQNPVPDSEYQKALDTAATEPKLTADNTLYWSDYLRINYHPKSQLTLKDWEYDPIKYPKGRLRGSSGDSNNTNSTSSTATFKGHDIGTNQWNQIQLESDKEYLDRSFRPILEQCDSLAGLTITTDVDSAWGGFTESMLAEIVDEYSSKIPRFVWGIYDQSTSKRLSVADNLSRIKSTAGLIEFSTLFVPLSLPRVDLLPKQITEIYGDLPLTPWQTTALYNLVYEPMSVLSSLRNEKRISMSSFADSLLNGAEGRNIVSAAAATSKISLLDFSTVLHNSSLTAVRKTPARPVRHFSKYALVRQPKTNLSAKKSGNADNYGIVDLRSGVSPWDLISESSSTTPSTTPQLLEKYFQEKELLGLGTSQSALYQNEQKDFPFSRPTSYPSYIINDDDSIYSSLSITTTPASTLTMMAGYVSRFDRGSDDREHLKDSLSVSAEAYSWGYTSDEDESDD